MASWYIGLMSGTSLDGVDGVLAYDGGGAASPPLTATGHVHAAFDPALRGELLALNDRGGPDELHRAALAANAIARAYAEVVERLLADARLALDSVVAVGAHGQTVRHRPREFDGTGYTCQLLNGALLAELAGIDVVCDFRNRDLAAGGVGAPLVPAFHAAAFGAPGRERALLNLGGIANLSLLHADGRVVGFDCGPANVLMDSWCRRERGLPYDAAGAWAASGRTDEALLRRLIDDEPFFALPPPKSTGRDLFDEAWLMRRLEGVAAAPADVMATLCELTAVAAAQALQRHAPATAELFACGGGAHNAQLMRRLAARLPGVEVRGTREALGVAPDQVEALAFAWLARECVAGRPIDLSTVTGAHGARPLGAVYRAK